MLPSDDVMADAAQERIYHLLEQRSVLDVDGFPDQETLALAADTLFGAQEFIFGPIADNLDREVPGFDPTLSWEQVGRLLSWVEDMRAMTAQIEGHLAKVADAVGAYRPMDPDEVAELYKEANDA